MTGTSGSFWFNVKIQTPPEFNPLTGQMEPARVIRFDSRESGDSPAGDVYTLTWGNSVNTPCGRFTLTMAPRYVEGNRTWADLIPAYSLVEIWVQRFPDDEECVMLGLVTHRSEDADFTQAGPMRTIRISGSAVSRVLVDQKTFWLPVNPATLAPNEPEEFLTDLRSGDASIPDLYGPAAEIFGTAILDPQLFSEGDGPIAVIDKYVRYIVEGKGPRSVTPKPLLNWALPTVRLEQILFFDPTRASLFDHKARLPAQQSVHAGNVPLWSLLSGYVSPFYQEFFSETRQLESIAPSRVIGADPGGLASVAVEIVLRKKPFAGRIDESGDLVDTRFPGGSQFDETFENDREQSIDLGGWPVQSYCYARSSDAVRNLFYTLPQAVNEIAGTPFTALHAPLMDTDPASPSFVRRFGLRLCHVNDPYLAERQGDVEHLARTRERLLMAWHRFEPTFLNGQITVAGHPRFRAGKRVVWTEPYVNRRLEFYVPSVTHTVSIRGSSPTYSTQLEVQRGWELPANS